MLSHCGNQTQVETKAKDNVFPINSDLRSSISLFGALTDAQVSKILAYAKRHTLVPGEKVFSQGDLPESIHLLVSGRIDLVVKKNGIFSLEATYHEGDSLGETALIGIQPQVGTAVVVCEDAELLEISRDAILDLYESDIELYGLLMMNIAREASRKVHCLMKSA